MVKKQVLLVKLSMPTCSPVSSRTRGELMWKLSAEERVLVNPAPVAAAAGLPEVAGAEQHLHCSRSRFWGSKRGF